MQFLNKIEAPYYFAEADKQSVKMVDDASEIVVREFPVLKGILDNNKRMSELLIDHKSRAKIVEQIVSQGVKDPEKIVDVFDYMLATFDVAEAIREMTFKRFRLDNCNNRFGSAEHLRYNREKKIIEIVEK